MAENFHDHIAPNIWPPNSQDLMLLDYQVWSVVEREVSEHLHNTKDSLKSAIIRVMSTMNQDHLIRACRRFRYRNEAVIQAVCVFIE